MNLSLSSISLSTIARTEQNGPRYRRRLAHRLGRSFYKTSRRMIGIFLLLACREDERIDPLYIP